MTVGSKFATDDSSANKLPVERSLARGSTSRAVVQAIVKHVDKTLETESGVFDLKMNKLTSETW